MHNFGYKLALARWACRYSDARPPRKTDGVLLESELPPHMRGKVTEIGTKIIPYGITPAYAGKSLYLRTTSATMRDHPRICGEKIAGSMDARLTIGSPPHMRGKEYELRTLPRWQRITPAYVGKSSQEFPS